MSDWNIRQLHLLVAFDAIMARGSLVAAADAMGVTQSAVSKQLAQLRQWLGDELFVRTSQGMQPTPHALALRDQVASLLTGADSLVRQRDVGPADFAGRFVLGGTDQTLNAIAAPLLEHMSAHAPQMQLITRPLDRDYYLRQLEEGAVNLLVAVNWHAPEALKQRLLGSDHFVCVMHKDHPLAGVNLTRKRFVEAKHILVSPLGSDRGRVDLALDELNLTRRRVAIVSAFNMVDEHLLGQDRICTLPNDVARRLAERAPVVIRKVPVTLPRTYYYALWHPRYGSEPRLRWVLEFVVRLFGR